MSISDIVIAAVLASVIFFAARRIIKDRKKGAACPGCGGCPAASSCTAKQPERLQQN